MNSLNYRYLIYIIKFYLFQCTNVVSANDAAAIAIQLFRLDARLCDQHPMKVARTTNNSSVSGNTLHEATTSLACGSSNTQDSQRLSHDASVQTNPCTVFQVNPVHTTDLSRSLSDAQISLTRTCSQTDINGIPCMVMNNTPYQQQAISASLPQITSFGTSNNTPYQQQAISASLPQITSFGSSSSLKLDSTKNEDGIRNTKEEMNPNDYENGDNIVNILNVGSLNIPDCIMNELRDMNVCLMDFIKMKKPLEHVACFETGNFIIFC